MSFRHELRSLKFDSKGLFLQVFCQKSGYAELSIPLALPFWVEGGMVVLQVLFCRWKGRPLFAAAPLHRWLEKRGMSAVNIFYSLCALSVCGLALAVCLARWA